MQKQSAIEIAKATTMARARSSRLTSNEAHRLTTDQQCLLMSTYMSRSTPAYHNTCFCQDLLLFLSRLTLVFIKTKSCFYQDLLLFLSTLSISGANATPTHLSILVTVSPAEAQHDPDSANVLTPQISIYHTFHPLMWRNVGRIHGANNALHHKIMCAQKQTVL